MKLLAVIFAGGLVAGGWFVFGVWQDPRTAGPAPIPGRYLDQAKAECVEGLSRAGEGAPGEAGFCGCVTREVGKRLSFRNFRAARIELEKARAGTGGSALPDLLRAHETLGPIIRACDAEQEAGASQGAGR